MKPILKYPGAKWKISDWIIQNLPPHESYLEPFFGSGAVFFQQKARKDRNYKRHRQRRHTFFPYLQEPPGRAGQGHRNDTVGTG